MADDYGRLNVALIPSVPEQEAQAEAERLRGARNLPEPQQSTSWADPIDTTPGDHDVTPYGGKSAQIPSTPPGSEGASAVSHQHYWIHTVTETIDRGYVGFNSVAMTLAEGVPVRILGLDDLRPRAELELLAQEDSNTAVYVGDRDVINSDSPQSSITAEGRSPIEHVRNCGRLLSADLQRSESQATSRSRRRTILRRSRSPVLVRSDRSCV